jgi:hypothetical protein
MGAGLDNPIVLWFVLTAALGGIAYAAMRKELRLRATLYGSFLIACAVMVWPPYEIDGKPGKIHLGLDLKGGVHLVLQVKTDEALIATVDDAVSTTRDQLQKKGIVFAGAQRKDTQSFSVDGVEPARVKDAREILKDYFREWDVREGADGGFTVKVTDTFTRLMAQKLSENLGQQFYVDNIPGATGNIGAELVSKAAPDGHTLFQANAGLAFLNTKKIITPIAITGKRLSNHFLFLL